MSETTFFTTIHSARFGPIAVEAKLAGKVGYVTSYKVVFGPKDKNPRYASVLIQLDGRQNKLYAVGQKPLNEKGRYPKAAEADLLEGFAPVLEHFRHI